MGSSTFIFDSVPPQQLLEDGSKSSDDEDEDLQLSEADLNAIPGDEDFDSDEHDSGLTIDEAPRRRLFECDATKKGRTKLTAFMLFAKKSRPQILASNPGLDFASLSKKLGELWSSLPASEKAMWKRKLSKMTSEPPQGQQRSMKVISRPITAGRTLSGPNFRLNKGTGTEPIDAAAHLKLLGESLSVIGQRLTEHKGKIAVAGSLSVLLDSLLCAMGPLVCLTKQVPELQDTVPQEKLNKILDNIAYVMPGL